ncbi:MAG: hypothetical protein ACD_54C00112G0001, partial [uncultured bacterium]
RRTGLRQQPQPQRRVGSTWDILRNLQGSGPTHRSGAALSRILEVRAVVTDHVRLRQDRRWHGDAPSLAFRRQLRLRAADPAQGCRQIRAAPGHGNALSKPVWHRFALWQTPHGRPPNPERARFAARFCQLASALRKPPRAAAPAPETARRKNEECACALGATSTKACRGFEAVIPARSSHDPIICFHMAVNWPACPNCLPPKQAGTAALAKICADEWWPR